MMPKVAFLVYDSWRQARRKDDSFDGLSNIGAYMLIDAAKKNGINIEFCSVDSANRYDIVLVSFTSNYDILAYAKAVFKHPVFTNRKFKVLAGGFGMQNPYPIQEYLDYVWFGRCENEISWLISNNLNVEHQSILDVKSWKVCKINQSNIYETEFALGTNVHGCGKYKETIMGCPNKCFYCHFTWARKHVNTGSDHYDVSMYSSSQELDMFNIDDYDVTKAKITVGLDGYSERLRKLVNRKNTNDDLIRFIEGISERTQIKGEAVFIKFYNIVGYESETINDYKEFVSILNKLKLKKRIVGIVHSTPLHPSPCTPLAYSRINLNVNSREHNGKPIIDEPLINCFHSPYQESAYGLFESIVVERAQASTQKVFEDVVFNTKLKALKSDQKIKALQMRHDISPLIREYQTTEELPTWFIEGYMSQDAIRKMRLQMKRKINGN